MKLIKVNKILQPLSPGVCYDFLHDLFVVSPG